MRLYLMIFCISILALGCSMESDSEIIAGEIPPSDSNYETYEAMMKPARAEISHIKIKRLQDKLPQHMQPGDVREYLTASSDTETMDGLVNAALDMGVNVSALHPLNPQTKCQGCPSDGLCLQGICICSPGFELSNGACRDINECALSPCRSNETCSNSVGNYSCQQVLVQD